MSLASPRLGAAFALVSVGGLIAGAQSARAFDPERYFRWRKYWDYSGGIATDLFYHSVSPLLVAIGGDFPFRATASGGIYLQKDREVPAEPSGTQSSWVKRLPLAGRTIPGAGGPALEVSHCKAGRLAPHWQPNHPLR